MRMIQPTTLSGLTEFTDLPIQTDQACATGEAILDANRYIVWGNGWGFVSQTDSALDSSSQLDCHLWGEKA